MKTKITDLTFLQEVAGDNKETFNDLLGILIEQSVEFIEAIPKYLAEKDWYFLGAIAHKAKASVRTIGMSDLGNKLETIEHLSKGNARLYLEQKKVGSSLTSDEEKQWELLKEEQQSDINLTQLEPLVEEFVTDYTLAIEELKELLPL